MSTPLPLYIPQAPIPPQTPARFVVVVGHPTDACAVTRIDLFPADGAPAEPNDYMICELVEEQGFSTPHASLAMFNTGLGKVDSTGDWESGVIAYTWHAPLGYVLLPGHSITARWDMVGSGQPVPGCAWRVTQ